MSKPAPTTTRRPIWRRPGWLILLAVTVSGIALGPSLVWLAPSLSEQPEYIVQLDQMQLPETGEWVPAGVAARALQDAGIPFKSSVLAPDLRRRAAEALRASPWIREVRSVRITGQPSVIADVVYRSPAAFVEVPGGLYAIDCDGVVLPPEDFTSEQAGRLPRIRGVQTQPQAVGAPWPDPIVAAAGRLADALAPAGDLAACWERFQVECLIAPTGPLAADAPEMIFELLLKSGNRVVWGRPPGQDDLEPTVEQKRARLEYLDGLGRLQAPQGPFRFDIRPFEDISFERVQDRRYH